MLTRIKDYYNKALDGDIVLTKFLDFEEIKEIKSLNKDGLKVYLNGGYSDAERVRAIIQFEYYDEPLNEEYEILIYHATYKKDYKDINHRNVLGSIMSLGIERNTFGDIYIYEDNIYIIISKEIEKFLIQNIPLINNQKLDFKKVDNISLNHKMAEKEIIINVASLRLDAIVARTLNISRNLATEMIESGLVFINHIECKNITHKCTTDEIISIRKFGRIRLIENIKTTKKDRLMVKMGVKH